MKKIIVKFLVAVFILLSGTLLASDKIKENTDNVENKMSFSDRKVKIIENLDIKIKRLTDLRECLQNANDPQEAKNCHKLANDLKSVK